MPSANEFEDEIKLSVEKHRAGCAALSGAETVLLQSRLAVGQLQIELEAARRRAKEVRLDDEGIRIAIRTLRELYEDLTTRRAAILEFHRDFRQLDTSLTPTRPPSDAALQAYNTSESFGKWK